MVGCRQSSPCEAFLDRSARMVDAARFQGLLPNPIPAWGATGTGTREIMTITGERRSGSIGALFPQPGKYRHPSMDPLGKRGVGQQRRGRGKTGKQFDFQDLPIESSAWSTTPRGTGKANDIVLAHRDFDTDIETPHRKNIFENNRDPIDQEGRSSGSIIIAIACMRMAKTQSRQRRLQIFAQRRVKTHS